MKLIYEGRLIGDEEIAEIEKTPEGMKRIASIKISSRVAFAAMEMIGHLQNELKALNREMSYQEREDFCNILFQCLLKMDQKYVDEYIEECYRHIEDHNFQFPQMVGHC